MTADVDHEYDDVVFDGDGHRIVRTDVTPSILVTGDDVTVENVTLDEVWDPMEYVGTTNGTIRNVTSLGAYGVRLTRTTETQVVDSHFENDLLSIDLRESDDNTVRNNSIWGSDRGIDLSGSHGNVVSENAHSTGFGYGIGLSQSTGNTILRNEVSGMSYWGYRLYHSDRNALVRNRAIENDDGFSLGDSDDNRLVRNTACDNEHDVVIEGDSTGNELVRSSTTVPEHRRPGRLPIGRSTHAVDRLDVRGDAELEAVDTSGFVRHNDRDRLSRFVRGVADLYPHG